jgi:sugar phosphate isomerase/epimerase
VFASFNARALSIDLSAPETIDLAASAGFAGVDLVVRDVVERGLDPAELRRRLDDQGLRGGAWPLVINWRSDPERYRRDLELLPRLAEAAAVLGLTRTGTWVLPETPDRPATEAARVAHMDAVARWHRDRLGPIIRVLDAHGTRLGLEAIGVPSFRTGHGVPFVTRLADLDAVLGADWGDDPTPGIILDSFHLYAADEDPATVLAWGIDRVVWVHLADLPGPGLLDRSAIQDHERGLPGDVGAVANRELLQMLADRGYDGPVTAEPLAACPALAGRSAAEAAHRVAVSLRRVWPTGIPGAPGTDRP